MSAIYRQVQVQVRMVMGVALAMILGDIIGLEREGKDKPVSLCTHMLVAGTAAFLVTLSDVAM